MISAGLAVVVAVAVIVLLMPRASIKIAREYRRLVVLVPIRQELQEDDHGAR
jgi:hypothetical protein